MATIRLRRAFRYPDELGGNENDREEFDEEEQEAIIKQLQLHNDQRNREYSTIFSIIPLLSVSIFILPILSPVSGVLDRILSLSSVLSLLATAYMMKFNSRELLDSKERKPMMKTNIPTFIHQHLLLINVATCTLLVVGSLTLFLAIPDSHKHAVTYCIPAAMLSIALVVHKLMASVDIKQLETLRYEYKGA